MTMVKQRIHQLTVPTPFAVGDVHIYLLEGDALTLIDAGVETEEAWSVFCEQLKEIGYTPEEIEHVVLTHHHPDHMGLIDRFSRAHTLAAHPRVEPWLSRDEGFFQRYERFFEALYEQSGVPDRYKRFLKGLRKPLAYSSPGEMTHYLREGDTLPGHEKWRVIETPGHAQSHISFYHNESGELLAGDHLLEHISPNPLLEPPLKSGDKRPRPLLDYRHSLKKLKDYNLTTIYPGHGNTFTYSDTLIHSRLKKQEERAEKVRQLLLAGSMTAFEVCEQLFPKHIDSQFGLTMSETIGQLDYLQSLDLVSSSLINEQEYYYVN
ncbi:MBL fold metallo-hydrolase [Thalassobacillus sp. CUG 92003]|uniref:MBL fold metallo-hydrolase n=1 Tax=Thalassobacillus sp. CUG 92003 TaxID=2736641 RepID=UPI0015E7AA5E|nr:MBL fold metallo-hydrolase [Thalassobacillus sp. CUG 92003]